MSQNGALNGQLSPTAGGNSLHHHHHHHLGGMIGGPNGPGDEMVQSSASSTSSSSSSSSSQNNENIQRGLLSHGLNGHHGHHMNGLHHHHHNSHHHQSNQQLSPDHSPPTSANAPWSLYAPSSSSTAHLQHLGSGGQLATIGATYGPGGTTGGGALMGRSIAGINQLRLVEFSGFVEKRRDPEIVGYFSFFNFENF